MERRVSAFPQIGDLLELEIEKLIFRGAGLARWMGKTVLVPHSAEGDRIRARVSQVKSDYLQAEIQEILSPSPQRTAPFCSHFPACGGCQWQHLSLHAQRQWKEKILRESLGRLERWGRLPICALLPTSHPEAYRTRAQIKVQRLGNRSRLGFFRLHSQELEEIGTCPLLHPDLQRIYRSLAGLQYPTLAQLYPALKEIWMLRGSPKGEILLALITPFGEKPALWLLYQRLKEACPALNGIALVWDQEGGYYDRVGTPWVEMGIEGMNLRVGPTCFYQVGEQGAESIFKVIENWGDFGELERVLDLYCGVGAFTLPLARRARIVVGVEAQQESASLARENAQRYGLSNVRIIHGAVEEALIGDLAKAKYDLVILDPPRSGLTRRAMEKLLRLTIPRIIYISCDPSTLARDLGHLWEGGYKCLRIQPLDLFPQTYHIETIVTLEKINFKA